MRPRYDSGQIMNKYQSIEKEGEAQQVVIVDGFHNDPRRRGMPVVYEVRRLDGSHGPPLCHEEFLAPVNEE